MVMLFSLEVEMTRVLLSKIQSPSGPLADIEKTSISISSQLPTSSWLDVELVDMFLRYHPVSVQKISKHYEIMSGFRAFHVVSALLDSQDKIDVRVTKIGDEGERVKEALFELFTQSLLHSPEAVETQERIYRQLKKLTVRLRKEHGVAIPTKFVGRNLKVLFGLDGRRISSSRKRKTELQRIMRS